MKKSLANRLYLGFAAVVLLVLMGGFLTWRTFYTQTDESRWVQHTYHVLNQAERIQRLMFDMEAGRRGFRGTFESRFLKPYELALPKVAPALNDLRNLVTDNVLQETNVSQLENNINTLLSYWNELEHLHFNRSFQQNIAITEKEEAMMDAVKLSIAAVNREERRLLAIREKEVGDSFKKAMLMLLLNNALLLLVASILIYITYKEFRRRMHIQQLLNRKLEGEVELNREARERNWILSAMNDMNDSLQGIHNLASLSRKCLATLTGAGNFSAGAFYHYDKQQEKLRLSGHVAMPAEVQKTFAVGEGITGYAATSRSIRIIEQLPDNYWQITSASGTRQPGTLVLIPLWMESELLGIIELACFRQVTPLEIKLLELLSKDIAIAVNAANDREKVMQLLQQVQEQKEILVSQQEELRQSNEELSRQSEILQASEEELRVQEEELRQVNAEMVVKNNALETTREALSAKATELESSSRYKSEFLANMSHELRTPLNSVLILARILEENKGGQLLPKQVEYASIIHKSGSDLLRLINDILDLSKIEAGKVELHAEDISVQGIISDLSDLFDVVAAERKIEFIKQVAPEVPKVITTDKLRLQQVIRNLLSNSFKFTPEGGVITMSWYMQPGNVLCISVTDTGEGIPADKQQLIFDAFHQGDGSTNRKYGGTGLGLSISRELITLLKGQISLDSSTAAGSTFTITIPVTGTLPVKTSVPDQEQAPPVEAFTPIQQPLTANDDRKSIGKNDKPVLIIEDDIYFADILRDFARNKGFKTIVAHNGQDGLFYARQYLPAAIILDMNLPVIDGSSILKILKSSDDLKNILVHVVSAAELPAATSGNVNGYTQKPLEAVDVETLFANISLQLQARLKQVLIISEGNLDNNTQLKTKSQERHLETQYDTVNSLEAATAALQTKKYDGIILDAGTDTAGGLQQLTVLAVIPATEGIPVIVYIDQDITPAEEHQLKKYAAAIVRNSSFSTDRLMDELELFLYKIKKTGGAPQPANISTPLEAAVLEGKTVLLADDDMRNVFSISTLLEEQGIRVLTAADGAEALSVLDTNPGIDLVLMDIMMPEMDGYEAMKHIRADKRFQQLPVIALTAKAMAGDRQQCIEAGASDYIAKPVDSGKLLSQLRVWLS